LPKAQTVACRKIDISNGSSNAATEFLRLRDMKAVTIPQPSPELRRCGELAISNRMPPTSAKPALATETKTTSRALTIVTTLFFMWGFITVLNDILVPHLKSIFDLSYTQVMLVQFSFFSAYFVFSMPAGKLVEWLGYKQTMVIGLCTMAVGAFLFPAAATAVSFPWFLAALIIVAAGITALQVSANPYVAVLGPENTASSRLNLAQAFNALGTTVGPYFGSLVILSAAPKAMDEIRMMTLPAQQAYRLHEAASVTWPYLGIGMTLLALAFFLLLTKLPKFAAVELPDSPEPAKGSLWNHPNLLLAAVAIFVYVGAEVSIGSFLVNYLAQPNIGGLTVKVAAGYVSFYWGGAMIGRFLGSAVLQKISTERLLGLCASTACLLVITSMLTVGQFAMWSILAVGFFNSIMFPSIFALGVRGLGPLTGKGSGLLVASIVGGAIIPELQGMLADHMGIHHAFFLAAICYLYILYFAVACSRTPHRTAPEINSNPIGQHGLVV
jgi:MFS transporter, FHS family, L-fucose permease